MPASFLRPMPTRALLEYIEYNHRRINHKTQRKQILEEKEAKEFEVRIFEINENIKNQRINYTIHDDTKTRGKKGSLNSDLNLADLILVFDEVYRKTNKYGRTVINKNTGEYEYTSSLEEVEKKHNNGQDSLVHYLWRGQQSRINFHLLRKVQTDLFY